MSFQEWNDDHWEVTVRDGYDGEPRYELKAPSVVYVFKEHDFLQLVNNLNRVAEHIYDKEVYYIHDENVYNRETGEQFLGAIGDCEEMNRLYKQNKKLEQEIEKLDTFKKILEYAENDSDRVDWQSYCEKEFEGL